MIPIIRTTITAYWRNNTFLQFAWLGILFACVSIIAVSISLGQSSKIMTDVRLTGIEIIGLISVIFFVATARKKARTDHSIHLILTHYHNKVRTYLAYVSAYLILIAILYVIMLIVALMTMTVSWHPPLPWFFGAVWLSFIKMIGLTSIARVLGSIMSGYLASIITLVVYMIGHSTGFVVYYFQQQWNNLSTALSKIIYYIFPNFQALDNHPLLAHTTSSLDITRWIIIMIIYSMLMLLIGVYIIRNQEF